MSITNHLSTEYGRDGSKGGLSQLLPGWCFHGSSVKFDLKAVETSDCRERPSRVQFLQKGVVALFMRTDVSCLWPAAALVYQFAIVRSATTPTCASQMNDSPITMTVLFVLLSKTDNLSNADWFHCMSRTCRRLIAARHAKKGKIETLRLYVLRNAAVQISKRVEHVWKNLSCLLSVTHYLLTPNYKIF